MNLGNLQGPSQRVSKVKQLRLCSGVSDGEHYTEKLGRVAMDLIPISAGPGYIRMECRAGEQVVKGFNKLLLFFLVRLTFSHAYSVNVDKIRSSFWESDVGKEP